jgi:hypothetical protein
MIKGIKRSIASMIVADIVQMGDVVLITTL